MQVSKYPCGYWDHLHLRGEHYLNRLLILKMMGSSPLTWRTLLRTKLPTHWKRIISTYVENTNICVAIPVVGWDHLHLRGEHLDTLQENARAAGSSPPTWRTPIYEAIRQETGRIISTYVENTLLNLW